MKFKTNLKEENAIHRAAQAFLIGALAACLLTSDNDKKEFARPAL